jgi:glutamate racemase
MKRLADVEKPIAFFDSGVGGTSVLAAAVKKLPAESFIYYGDTLHAPYGSRSVSDVRELSARVAGELYGKGCKALVVACNTATSAAINFLREVMPVPVIGMEPAVKPALERGCSGKVLVMATPLTLAEEKFRNLCGHCGAAGKVMVLPCPGIVEQVERGQITGPGIERSLKDLLKDTDTRDLSTVVLGCTHYHFIRPALARLLPQGVDFVGGNCGTVRQLQRILAARGLLREDSEGKKSGTVSFFGSGGPEAERLFRRLFEIALRQFEQPDDEM